jgi:4-hydroxybenzoyl-CoA thioesterase/acyl-CoA thioester hydrolase
MPIEFRLTRLVQFAETDLAGVLYFANYYRIMEETEHAFWRSLGLSVISGEGEDQVSWPRVATSCEYFAPARFEDRLELRLVLTHVGDRSLAYEVEFFRDGQRIALGRTTAVCCKITEAGFQPVRIPDRIRSRLLTAASGGTATE